MPRLSGLLVIFALSAIAATWSLKATSWAQQESVTRVMGVWTEGIDNLSGEEADFFRGLAEQRLSAPDRRGGSQGPGATSAITPQPFFYDLVEAIGLDDPNLDQNLRALIAQNNDRFYYFESGVTINKARWESIDAVLFELRFKPPERVSTYSQTPDHKTQALLTIGISGELELKGDFKVKPKSVRTGVVDADVGVTVKGGLSAALNRKFDFQETVITAVGLKQPWARWSILTSDLIRDDMVFIAVLRVPEGVDEIEVWAHVVFIDKLFGLLELSRRDKSITFRCTLRPSVCQTAN